MSWEEEKKKVQVWKPISFKGDGRGRKTLNFTTGKEKAAGTKGLKTINLQKVYYGSKDGHSIRTYSSVSVSKLREY